MLVGKFVRPVPGLHEKREHFVGILSFASLDLKTRGFWFAGVSDMYWPNLAMERCIHSSLAQVFPTALDI